MVQAQNGDQTAYRKLLSELDRILDRYLSSRIQNFEDRQDVKQNILIGVHRARNTYIPGKPFEPWFFAITRYKFIDYLRKHKRYEPTAELKPDSIPSNYGSTSALEVEEKMELDGYLSLLDERQRTIIQYLKIEKRSVKEIAKMTSLSESNVKVIAHRALKVLQKRWMGKEA